MECETLEHLFLDCQYVKPIWEKLENKVNYQFERDEKIFGLFRDPYDKIIFSHLTIIVKYYIHSTRLKKWKPHFSVLIKYINTTESIEFEIARNRNKMSQHSQKWEPLEGIFNV